jgi:hypothetical protein
VSESWSVTLDGVELARITGEGFSPCKKIVGPYNEEKMVDDPKMLRLVKDRKTILVFYVSSAENVKVERV